MSDLVGSFFKAFCSIRTQRHNIAKIQQQKYVLGGQALLSLTALLHCRGLAVGLSNNINTDAQPGEK
jgi:hypothetical protein